MSRNSKFPKAKVCSEDADLEAVRQCLLALPWRSCKQCGQALLRVGWYRHVPCTCGEHLMDWPCEYALKLESYPITGRTTGRLRAAWTAEMSQDLEAFHHHVREEVNKVDIIRQILEMPALVR